MFSSKILVLLQLICSLWNIVTAMENNHIQAFDYNNYGRDLTTGNLLTQTDHTNYVPYYHNVDDVQTNYQLSNEQQGIMVNKSSITPSHLLTEGLSQYDQNDMVLHSYSMSLISSDKADNINDASALSFWHSRYHPSGQNLSNYHIVQRNYIKNSDNVIVPIDNLPKHNLPPFPNDYHYDSDFSPQITTSIPFNTVPMINPSEYGTQSLSNGCPNGAYCSTTFTSELDPIINQQIGKVAKPDNWVQNVANHPLSDAKQYSPMNSSNSMQDNTDEDILNKMDAMDLSHTRLLTDGILSTNGHEYVLNQENLSDHKNVHRQKTKRLKATENAIWKIGLYRKSNDNEIECIVCKKPIKSCAGGRYPSKAIRHLQTVHKNSHYVHKYEELMKPTMEQMEQMEKNIKVENGTPRKCKQWKDFIISPKTTKL